MLIHDRLRRGSERELPVMLQQMADLALSYEAPPTPLTRTRTLVRPARRPTRADPGVRLLYAIAELSAQKGYRNVSVNDLAPHAKTSLGILYERYGGKEQCFLACFEMVRARTLQHALAAFEPLMPDWPQALHAALTAIMRYFASEPDLTRLVMVEVLAAGPVAFSRRDEAIRSFIALFDPGYERAPHAPALAREAIPFGIYALVHRHLIKGRPASSLPQLAPIATFFALAPAIGAKQAALIASTPIGSQQPAPISPVRG
jgi:AcrR family transcriptional regulator